MNELKDMNRAEQMIRQQIIERGINDPAVLSALRSVPRDRFFPSEVEQLAFSDRAVPIGHGQTISQPYIVALMTQRLELEPQHKVLEIGTGSGYQTAVLAQLVKDVYTVERIKPLLDQAWERVMDLNIRNAHFRHGDGTLGWMEAGPFDRILITAGGPSIPEKLLRTHLKNGGLAILPVGDENEQMLISIRKRKDELVRTDICPCRFVKLIGDEAWAAD